MRKNKEVNHTKAKHRKAPDGDQSRRYQRGRYDESLELWVTELGQVAAAGESNNDVGNEVAASATTTTTTTTTTYTYTTTEVVTTPGPTSWDS